MPRRRGRKLTHRGAKNSVGLLSEVGSVILALEHLDLLPGEAAFNAVKQGRVGDAMKHSITRVKARPVEFIAKIVVPPAGGKMLRRATGRAPGITVGRTRYRLY